MAEPKIIEPNMTELKIIARPCETVKRTPDIKQVIKLDMQPIALPEKPGIDFGIEETLDVVNFGVSFANGIINTFDDGKVTLGDLPNFLGAVLKLPAAVSGLDKVPAELGNLTDEELAQITAQVKEQLQVTDEQAIAVVEASINAAYSVYNLVKAVKGA